MKKRNLRAETQFTGELGRLFRTPRKADEILEEATNFFSHSADSCQKIDGTVMFYKIIADFEHKRWLVIFFTMNDRFVMLQSIRAFAV